MYVCACVIRFDKNEYVRVKCVCVCVYIYIYMCVRVRERGEKESLGRERERERERKGRGVEKRGRKEAKQLPSPKASQARRITGNAAAVLLARAS